MEETLGAISRRSFPVDVSSRTTFPAAPGPGGGATTAAPKHSAPVCPVTTVMILTWIQGSDVEPDALDGLGNMSKAEMLRVVVSEKLATAAQEILAVVERTLAGYEEEATGFRQEIDRQRRQLEVLLQPEIKLESTGRWLSALGVNGP